MTETTRPTNRRSTKATTDTPVPVTEALRPLKCNPSNAFETYIVQNEDAGTAAIRTLLDLNVTSVTVAMTDNTTRTYTYA